MMGLPWDSTWAQCIMGVQEEEVRLWKTCKGFAVRVAGCVCVVWKGGVFWFDESSNIYEQERHMRITAVWWNRHSPADRRSHGVPGIHAPPARCLGWGCRDSDLQRASCWAGWVTASPPHPAPPSSHHLAVLQEKSKRLSWKENPIKLITAAEADRGKLLVM